MPRPIKKYWEYPVRKASKQEYCRLCEEYILKGEKRFVTATFGSLHEHCVDLVKNKKIKHVYEKGWVWVETGEDYAKMEDDDVKGKLGWVRKED